MDCVEKHLKAFSLATFEADGAGGRKRSFKFVAVSETL
jgi:hypothetical protein